MSKVSLINEFIRERFGLDDSWRWASLEALPHGPPPYTKIKVEMGRFVEGRGGTKVYVKPYVKFTVSVREHDEWCSQWEVRTGKCSECEGGGDVMRSWDISRGEVRVPCGKCKGSGKSQKQVTA